MGSSLLWRSRNLFSCHSPAIVLEPLRSVRFARRDDAYDRLGLLVTVADDEHPQRRTETEQYEPILALGMIGISNYKRVIICENGRSFFKRDAVLPTVGGVLSLVPLKPQFSHV